MESIADFDRTENLPYSGDEEVVVAARTVQESESVHAVQAVSVTQRVEGGTRQLQRRELEGREQEEPEFQRRQKEERVSMEAGGRKKVSAKAS